MGAVLGHNPSTVYNKSEGQRFAGDATLQVVDCATCGVTYAIPASFYRSALKYPGDAPNGWKICCPFGHTWWYRSGQSEEAKLRHRLDLERAAAGRLASRLEQTKAELVGTKAARTRFRNERDRLKTRAAAGVCPCCNRTFKQLARHMESKHPGFGPDLIGPERSEGPSLARPTHVQDADQGGGS